MNETLAVAQADGAKLGPDRIETLLEHSRKNLRALKTSTRQDYDRGARLEYDALSGGVVRAAHRHNVAVPAMETVHALLKLLDRSSSNRNAASEDSEGGSRTAPARKIEARRSFRNVALSDRQANFMSFAR